MYTYAARLVRVVDGDTVDLDIDLGFHITVRERFRLAGIDTPELRDRNTELRAAAYEAMRYLEHLLQGKPLHIATAKGRKEDKYGRWLVTIYAQIEGEEMNVNLEMLERGYARPVEG